MEAHGLYDGGWIRETQRKGVTTTGRVKMKCSWTCQKADSIKKRRRTQAFAKQRLWYLMTYFTALTL